MKAVLVGGGGFIGHHTALEMARVGWEPTIIDSFAINNLYALKPEETLARAMIKERFDALAEQRIPIIHLDARQYQMLSETISALRPDVILHLAAVSHIDRGNKDPYSTLDHSLRTLENSLDIARALATRIVYFSSSTVYGDWTADVLDEASPCNPRGVYGAMKLCGEILVNAYRDTYDLPTTIIRPCALYGPRCISRRVTQIFVENALLGKPITVRGGAEKIDFTYIDDLVDGIMRVCRSGYGGVPWSSAVGETFNITGGQARSLAELKAVVASKISGTNWAIVPFDSDRPRRGTMSIVKAGRMLGYVPWHKLELGMEKYVGWYRDFLDRQEQNVSRKAESSKSSVGIQEGQAALRLQARPEGDEA